MHDRYNLNQLLGGEMQYEYKTVVLTVGFIGLHKQDLDRADLDRQLAALGAEGWELCGALMDQALQAEDDGHVLIFKRLVEKEYEEELAEEELAEEEPAEEEFSEEEPAEEEFSEEELSEEPLAPHADNRGARPGRRQRQAPRSRRRSQRRRREEPADEKPKDCVECGEPLREGAKFCGQCGTAVDA